MPDGSSALAIPFQVNSDGLMRARGMLASIVGKPRWALSECMKTFYNTAANLTASASTTCTAITNLPAPAQDSLASIAHVSNACVFVYSKFKRAAKYVTKLALTSTFTKGNGEQQIHVQCSDTRLQVLLPLTNSNVDSMQHSTESCSAVLQLQQQYMTPGPAHPVVCLCPDGITCMAVRYPASCDGLLQALQAAEMLIDGIHLPATAPNIVKDHLHKNRGRLSIFDQSIVPDDIYHFALAACEALGFHIQFYSTSASLTPSIMQANSIGAMALGSGDTIVQIMYDSGLAASHEHNFYLLLPVLLDGALNEPLRCFGMPGLDSDTDDGDDCTPDTGKLAPELRYVSDFSEDRFTHHIS